MRFFKLFWDVLCLALSYSIYVVAVIGIFIGSIIKDFFINRNNNNKK